MLAEEQGNATTDAESAWQAWYYQGVVVQWAKDYCEKTLAVFGDKTMPLFPDNEDGA